MLNKINLCLFCCFHVFFSLTIYHRNHRPCHLQCIIWITLYHHIYRFHPVCILQTTLSDGWETTYRFILQVKVETFQLFLSQIIQHFQELWWNRRRHHLSVKNERAFSSERTREYQLTVDTGGKTEFSSQSLDQLFILSRILRCMWVSPTTLRVFCGLFAALLAKSQTISQWVIDSISVALCHWFSS